MDLNALLILCEVVKHRSFSRAARQLKIPSSNVSRKLQALENEMGVKLIHRTTRSVTPTSDGQKIVELARGLLESNQDIKEWVLGQKVEPEGLLRITSPETFAQWPLGEWLIEFQQLHPKVEIELITDSSNLSFDDFELDYAFRFGPLPDSNLIAKELFKIAFGFFAARELLSVYQHPNSIDELQTLPAIGCTAEQQVLPWFYLDGQTERMIFPQTCFRVKDQSIALTAALSGLGVAFLPISLVNRAEPKDVLIPLLKPIWPKPISFHMIYRERRGANPARYHVFQEFIMGKLAETQAREVIEGISYR